MTRIATRASLTILAVLLPLAALPVACSDSATVKPDGGAAAADAGPDDGNAQILHAGQCPLGPPGGRGAVTCLVQGADRSRVAMQPYPAGGARIVGS